MARPLRIQFPGAFYHVTSRGNERRDIFIDDTDRKKFLSYIQTSYERYNPVFHAYCLMDNHYHILLETPEGNLSRIIRHINGAYTTYFNSRHKRSGHLFQGRYKSVIVEADEYAAELSRYIHLNPVRAGITKQPEQYPWSSYRYYLNNKHIPKWLDVDFILGYFSKRKSVAKRKYSEFVDKLINDENYNPLENVVASTLLGSSDFVNQIKDTYLNDKIPDRDLPSLKRLVDKPKLAEIVKETESLINNDGNLSRKAALYISHRYSGRSLKEIGQYFGLTESGVTQSSRRFEIKLKNDRKLSRDIKLIKKELNLSNV